jgi:hypothetical protein
MHIYVQGICICVLLVIDLQIGVKITSNLDTAETILEARERK